MQIQKITAGNSFNGIKFDNTIINGGAATFKINKYKQIAQQYRNIETAYNKLPDLYSNIDFYYSRDLDKKEAEKARLKAEQYECNAQELELLIKKAQTYDTGDKDYEISYSTCTGTGSYYFSLQEILKDKPNPEPFCISSGSGDFSSFSQGALEFCLKRVMQYVRGELNLDEERRQRESWEDFQ